MALGFTVGTIFKGKDEISGDFKRMGRNAKKFQIKTSKAFRAAGKSATGFKSIVKGILTAGLISKGFQLVGEGLRVVTTEFLDFDDAITQASAKFKGLNLSTKEGQKTLLELKNTAREVGKTTKFSAAEAAAGLDFYATAGFNAAQAMRVLAPTAKLAMAANTGLSRTADIAGDVLGIFGKRVDDPILLMKNFNDMSNQMAFTITSTNTTLESLFETTKAAGVIFAETGQSMGTFNAIARTLADRSVKGEKAGIGMRTLMANLAKATPEAAEALEALGVSVRDQTTGGFRDLLDILKDMRIGFEGMGEQAKLAGIKTIFGKPALAAVSVLLSATDKELRKYRDDVEGATGATDKMAKIMGGSLKNKLLGLRSATIDVGFQLFEAFQKKAGKAIDFLADKVRQIDLTPFIEKLKTVIKFAGNMFEKFKAFGEKTGIFDAVKESLNAAIPLFKKTFEFLADVSKKFIEIGERTGLFDKIATGIKAVVPFFSTVLSVVSTIFTLLERLGVFDTIAKGIGVVIDVLVKMGDKFSEIWNTIKPFIDGIKDFGDFASRLGFGGTVQENMAAARTREIEGGGLSIGQEDVIKLIQATSRGLESAFSGTLNIEGAPEGSFFTPSQGSDNPINVDIMGGAG